MSLHAIIGLIVVGVGAVCRAQEATLRLGDVRLHYEVAGAGAPVVLIHGLANDVRTWDDQVGPFAQSFRVIRYDRRGFGRSTGIPDLTADPSDLAMLLDSLGIAAAHVVGHSAGARVALAFAVWYPQRVRGLVLYSSGPPDGFPLREEDRLLFGRMPRIAREHGLDSLGRLIMSLPAFHVPAHRSDVRDRVAAMWAAYSGRDILETHPPSGRTPLGSMDELARVRAPTLVIAGDADGAMFLQISDSLAARIRGAERATVRGGGHVVHMLQPAAFNAAVIAFLRRVDRQG